MTRGEITGRTDVNFWRLTPLFRELFKQPRFPAVPIGSVVVLVQYGCSERATEEPIGTPMLRMNNLQNDGWDLSDLKYIVMGEEDLERYRLQPGDLLFNRTNSKELVGKCEMFVESGDWVFASYLIRVRLDSAKILPRFACDFLSTRAGRLQIDRLSRQIIGMTNINAEELKEILLPVPADTKQQVKLVAAMDAARTERRAKLAEADALLTGLDDFLLATLGLTPLPKDDRKVFAVKHPSVRKQRLDAFFFKPELQLADALTRAYKGGTVALKSLLAIDPINGKDAREYAADGQRYLRVQNVRPFELDLASAVRIARSDSAKVTLQEGDVLLTRKGSYGIAARVENGAEDCAISSEVILLRLSRTSQCSTDFLVAWLNSSVIKAYLNRWKSGAIMGHITQDVVSEIPIPLAVEDEQKRITAEVKRCREEARRLRAEADAGWQAAKRWFEEQLLGPAQP